MHSEYDDTNHLALGNGKLVLVSHIGSTSLCSSKLQLKIFLVVPQIGMAIERMR